MADRIECDSYGFFNGVYGIEHSNWARFWQGIIPDGVISDDSYMLEVRGESDGLKVHVRPGKAIVAGHCVWVTSEKLVELDPNTSGDTRTDGIFIRVSYGNYGESKVTLMSKPGVISCTKNIGATYDLLLATVTVANGASVIAAADVTDCRYAFHLSSDEGMLGEINVSEGSGIVKVKNDRIHRYNTGAVDDMKIVLPDNPPATFMSEVDFTSSASFTTVKFYIGSTQITPKTVGDGLTETSKRYNILVWRDGSNWWAAVKAV